MPKQLEKSRASVKRKPMACDVGLYSGDVYSDLMITDINQVIYRPTLLLYFWKPISAADP